MGARRPGGSVGKTSPQPSKNGAGSGALSPPSPHQNHLLDALPAAAYERVAAHLELVPMRLGDVLYESGDPLRYVYFPTTSIISLLYVMEDGASAEIAVVGNEGILGISLFMGGDPLVVAGRQGVEQMILMGTGAVRGRHARPVLQLQGRPLPARPGL